MELEQITDRRATHARDFYDLEEPAARDPLVEAVSRMIHRYRATQRKELLIAAREMIDDMIG